MNAPFACSAIEDSLLAMAVGDNMSLPVALRILQSGYGRRIDPLLLRHALGRLARQRMLRWQYRWRGKRHFSSRWPQQHDRGTRPVFKATAAAEHYLAATSGVPRNHAAL
ncbi:hypothetical protein IGB42_02979 [Andreprevotia sp. IGB-42]|uniref:hypothetical protein n=1 Tax=Andreprevotia sp. IGB-42 TaxID=2497473 RepID=UPI00135B5A00|nr:hypothetical protein [Andreprevotia sp. IGB-42]KAF0812687.1 hypothetical protein IGB42_02979 [Andreprevotia sp. IGB-42]